MVSARKLIARGAVEISDESVQMLQQKGVQFSEAQKAKVVGNLLTVICGESGVQPTIQLEQ